MTGSQVVVIGANRGLGLEFARLYLEAGCSVLATARDLGAATGLRELADRFPETARLAAVDVQSDQQVQRLVAELGVDHVDILIHNAGIFGNEEESIASVRPEVLATVFDVNSIGPLRVVQAFWSHLREGSKTLLVTSEMGSIADASAGHYAYRMSKAALNMATKLLGAEAMAEGKTLFTVHPGWVQTDMGGPNAPLTIERSVASMVATVERADASFNGRFLDRDGEPLRY